MATYGLENRIRQMNASTSQVSQFHSTNTSNEARCVSYVRKSPLIIQNTLKRAQIEEILMPTTGFSFWRGKCLGLFIIFWQNPLVDRFFKKLWPSWTQKYTPVLKQYRLRVNPPPSRRHSPHH